MKSPITGKEMTLRTESREFIFRRERYDIMYQYYKCEESGEKFEDLNLTNINLTQIHNKYREAHNLPFVHEIKEIRQKYGLSAAKMSEILGFGVNTYRNYEDGEVPSDANGRLILMSSNPTEFRQLIVLSSLSETEKERILKKVSVHPGNPGLSICDQGLFKLCNEKPDIFNGYRRLNIEKAFALATWFAAKQKPWKTQLNKLLFYTDFLNFRMHGYSVTGLQYKAIQRGPVPEFYETIYELAENEGYLRKEYKSLVSGHDGEIIHAVKDYKAIISLFTEEEVDTINKVNSVYGKLKVSEIVDLSHSETAWQHNISGEDKISYDYAFSLKETKQ
jgi:putative zinc finger/helix-turn-helix YgiT family protein